MITLRTATTDTLDQLKAAVCFNRVGMLDGSEAVGVSSWSEAIEFCSRVSWENLKLAAANAFRERLQKASPGRLNQWNALAEVLRPVVKALFLEKAADTAKLHQLPAVFRDCVHWDLIHLLFEAEYSEVVDPGFYFGQGYWYVNGHFPCGWDAGRSGPGRPIVY